LALLRHYLTVQNLPLRERAAACLMLTYGQPISRILRLRQDDLNQLDAAPVIRFGDPPTPVPEPLAMVLRELAAASLPSRWLFPARNAGQPITSRPLPLGLRALDMPLGQARISALRRLVTQVPAPVIADALGIYHTTATRQANNAGTTWNRY